MSAPPYMKLYIADYLADTTHLSAVEHGAYLLLLMAIWRAGGRLPADDAKLAKIARMAPAEWTEIRTTVLAFFKRTGGRLTHKRVTKEMASYGAVFEARKEAGKRGGIQKANKNNENRADFAKDFSGNCHHNQNQNHIDTEGDKSPSAQTGDFDPDASAWAIGKSLLIDKAGMKADAAGRFIGKLLSQHGLRARDLFSTFALAASNATDDPKSYLAAAAAKVAQRLNQPALTLHERALRSNII